MMGEERRKKVVLSFFHLPNFQKVFNSRVLITVATCAKFLSFFVVNLNVKLARRRAVSGHN
jgi:hypothetical protein